MKYRHARLTICLILTIGLGWAAQASVVAQDREIEFQRVNTPEQNSITVSATSSASASTALPPDSPPPENDTKSHTDVVNVQLDPVSADDSMGILEAKSTAAGHTNNAYISITKDEVNKQVSDEAALGVTTFLWAKVTMPDDDFGTARATGQAAGESNSSYSLKLDNVDDTVIEDALVEATFEFRVDVKEGQLISGKMVRAIDDSVIAAVYVPSYLGAPDFWLIVGEIHQDDFAGETVVPINDIVLGKNLFKTYEVTTRIDAMHLHDATLVIQQETKYDIKAQASNLMPSPLEVTVRYPEFMNSVNIDGRFRRR